MGPILALQSQVLCTARSGECSHHMMSGESDFCAAV